MIRSVKIENFKSVRDLELELGRVTVLIGANGSGKSNILEAIGMASAVASDKLDNEFLASRGIRVSGNPRMMLSAFEREDISDAIGLSIGESRTQSSHFSITHAKAVSNGVLYDELDGVWLPGRIGGPVLIETRNRRERMLQLADQLESAPNQVLHPSLVGFVEQSRESQRIAEEYLSSLHTMQSLSGEKTDIDYLIALRRFLIYAPENRELRTFAEEGQILPLGIRGEGLFRLLKIMASQDDGEKLTVLKEKLQLIDWFEDFDFPTDAMAYERSLRIKDRHLSDDLAYIDQRSANEGFLYLLFYFCLLISDAPPPFFAIDNIDASLNPKLCERLIQEMVELAKANGKQFIVTTHNPAILDGLNLHDDEQRLYSVRRNRNGETRADRIEAPKVEEGQTPVRLSEAYLRGYLGGLPTNF